MRRTLVFALIAILIGTLWYFFVVSPINERKDIARIDLETAQTEEFTLRTTLSRLRKIEENQLEYATAINQLENAIPPTPQLAQLIDDLNFLADENGLAWNSASYALPSAVQGSDLFEIRVAIQVDGQFFEVLGYLYSIAELDRIVRVDAVALSSSADESGFHSMAATIDAVVFTTGEVSASLDFLSIVEEAAEEEAADGEAAAEEGSESEESTDDGSSDASTTTTTEGA